jgi:hypothetical protein
LEIGVPKQCLSDVKIVWAIAQRPRRLFGFTLDGPKCVGHHIIVVSHGFSLKYPLTYSMINHH